MTLISQNKAENKVKVTLSISAIARERARKMGLNMSSVLENTLIHGLFSDSQSAFEINVEKKQEIHAKPHIFSSSVEQTTNDFCARSSFTPDEMKNDEWLILPISMVNLLVNSDFSSFTESKRKLLICHIRELYLLQGGKKDKSTMFIDNISTINDISSYMSYMNYEKMKNPMMPMMLNTTSCMADKVYYINDVFMNHKSDFIAWARKTIKSESTLKGYVKILESFTTISRPNDILNYESRNKCQLDDWKVRALRKFLKYLEEANDTEEEVTINGFSISMFRKKLSIVESDRKLNNAKTAKQIAEEKTIKDAKELTADDILEEYSLIPDELKQFFKIMVYSGIRASHLLRLLSSPNKRIDDKGRYIKVSASDVQLGNKKQFIALYAPAECKKYIENFRLSKFKTCDTKRVYTYSNLLSKFKNNLSSGRRITSKSLRKFNLNFLVNTCGVEGRLADYAQSRTDGSIRAKHYENLEKPTDEAYDKCVSKFLELLAWN